MTSLIQDVRFAVRGLLRQRVLLGMALLALTFGVAAIATMFGVVNQLYLRPPDHVVEPGTVRRIYYTSFREGQRQEGQWSAFPIVSALQGTPAFSALAGYFQNSVTFGRGPNARSVNVQLVTANYFPLLGVRPQLGRFFNEEEDRPPHGTQVAVLSDGFWKLQLGGEDVIGRVIQLDGKSFTVVGIAPRRFSGIDRGNTDLWLPISAMAANRFGDDWHTSPNNIWVQAIARVRSDVPMAVATEQATTRYRAQQKAHGTDDSTSTVALGPIIGARTPGGWSADAKIVMALLAVSALVLLIACANVANLLIARMLQRRREIAVRLALGAGRVRLLRQMLTEAAVLALAATMLALLLAQWTSRVVQDTIAPHIVWSGSVLDPRTLAFAIAVVAVCIVAAGMLPALYAFRTDVNDGLKTAPTQIAHSGGRVRGALLALQAALSLILLVGAGLFVDSLHNVSGRDVGIDVDRVSLIMMDLERSGFAKPQVEDVFARAKERLAGMPGVERASVVRLSVPLRSGHAMGFSPAGGNENIPGGGPYYSVVDGDYFRTIGADILTGRDFDIAEDRVSSRVMIVNDVLAGFYWPGESAIGKCVTLGGDNACTEIVGVVRNPMLFQIVNDDRAQLYLPLGHPAFGGQRHTPAAIVVRTAAHPRHVVPLMQREIQSLSRNMPFVRVNAFDELLQPQLRTWRIGATMFSLFGGVAIVIAAVGLYSVLAYWVAQRTREIGVRLALGAQGTDIVRMVMRQSAGPLGAGLLIGGVAAWTGGRWVADLLYETSIHDMRVYVSSALILIAAGAAASFIPARRSAAVPPATALRAE